ncbi:hypothetical protein DIPPA_54806 [Diplonema papillatum]|nr:hypothetical protein DIPPA_54806 [Diplonema papillatum]
MRACVCFFENSRDNTSRRLFKGVPYRENNGRTLWAQFLYRFAAEASERRRWLLCLSILRASCSGRFPCLSLRDGFAPAFRRSSTISEEAR